MSEDWKVSARAAVESLRADNSTNIGDGLRVAAEVLDGRRHRNAVASIILLSDGQDNTMMHGFYNGGVKSYVDLVPHSLRRSSDNRCLPVHMFGFGTDHDAATTHAIAEVAGGTFSFIENQEVVQDSFAQCIGGLLSVTVQEARISLECLHPGVRVRTIKSGCYRSRVDADGRTALVDVGELYAEEERRFLLFVGVPVAASGDGVEGSDVTRLINATCAYKDAATRQLVDVAGEDAIVQRPVVVVAAGTEPSMDVARERFRVETAEDIASALVASILDRRRESSAAAGLAGDERCAALVAELGELSSRVANWREYEDTGRAFMLVGMSSHAQQRASTVQLFSSAGSRAGGFGAASAGTVQVRRLRLGQPGLALRLRLRLADSISPSGQQRRPQCLQARSLRQEVFSPLRQPLQTPTVRRGCRRSGQQPLASRLGTRCRRCREWLTRPGIRTSGSSSRGPRRRPRVILSSQLRSKSFPCFLD
jgi:hypothetical protein